MEKVGRDEPPISVGRGENHTSLGEGGYARFGSIPDFAATSHAVG
jgi:hypothetical protein